MNIYHATPYDISAMGFYFKTYEEFVSSMLKNRETSKASEPEGQGEARTLQYRQKAEKHINAYGQPVEEFEIQFIDGDNYELFNALRINQANLKEWFETYEDMDDEDAAKVIYLFDHLGYTTYTANDIADKLDDIYLFEGTAMEYAEQYLEETGLLNEIPQHLRYYFDTEAYARDMLLNGDIAEVEIMNTRYIAMGG